MLAAASGQDMEAVRALQRMGQLQNSPVDPQPTPEPETPQPPQSFSPHINRR